MTEICMLEFEEDSPENEAKGFSLAFVSGSPARGVPGSGEPSSDPSADEARTEAGTGWLLTTPAGLGIPSARDVKRESVLASSADNR